MSRYKECPLIPGWPNSPDDLPTTETASLAATTVTSTGGGTTPPPTAPVDASPVAWGNGRWAVTEAGLESRTRAGPKHETLVEYGVPADQLLRTWPSSAGVSNCAVQLAGKTWVVDVEELLQALQHALRVHHPGQTAVDMTATAEAARHEWERTHRPSPGTGEFGWEYGLGEATLRAIDEREAAAERQKGELAPTDGPKQDDAPDFVEAPDEDETPELDDLAEDTVRDNIEKRHRRP